MFKIFGVLIVIVALITLFFGWPLYIAYGTADTVTFTVKDKERVQDGNSSRYLVFTDKETFENTDSLLKGKNNSSDLYGKLDRKGTYTCDVNGKRIPFFSMYRNLLECKSA